MGRRELPLFFALLLMPVYWGAVTEAQRIKWVTPAVVSVDWAMPDIHEPKIWFPSSTPHPRWPWGEGTRS
jgi:hypothetical protein